ncbi:ferredoxin-NADP reductase [Povalibacter uvarum]|uniref:Ferredoxin-NADP reductase n=1 Tax=Povalibacter uvarum TaxID=732238 RepID=A0A841HU24_9GAMM|nr:ferredoxin reductase [Povalibacter uvarum]MBB6095482.1 ferredoxin-NADP reductase [Povalibacter uvarum]
MTTNTSTPDLHPGRLQWQSAVITAIVPRTARIKSFFLRLPQPFDFLAGQHVDVRLSAEDGYQAQRSYSIASAPDASGEIELAIERLEDGEVSPFFHDIAVVGDEIELRGPIGGYFVWSIGDAGPIVLIGGGSGLVPLVSMIRHRANQRVNTPFVLLASARTWDDVLYRDELLQYAARQDGFQLVLTTTREGARRPGDFERRIDRQMIASMLACLSQTPRQCLVCGSNPFVEAASQALIAAAVNADVIRTERYG